MGEENGDLSFLFYFSKQCFVENIQRKFKTNSSAIFISEDHLKSFQRKIFQMGAAEVAKFHTNPYNFVACLLVFVPNPYKLSISLGDI